MEENVKKSGNTVPWYKNDDLKTFGYIALLLAVLFTIQSLTLNLSYVSYYIIGIIGISLLLLFSKKLIGMLLDVGIKEKPWTEGAIFSAVITFAMALGGLPVIVPILKTPTYFRLSTLKGLKKGEVKTIEKWNIYIFSMLMLVSIAFVMLYAYTKYNNVFLFESGFLLITYSLINMLPIANLDGAFIAYHNVLLYVILFALLLAITLVVPFYYFAALSIFIALVAFGIVTKFLHLWT